MNTGKGSPPVTVPPIGTASEPRTHLVEAGAIRDFSQALGLNYQAYYSKSYAQSFGFADIIAPPTFAITLAGHPVPGLDLPHSGLIHGDQAFKFGTPIAAHDTIRVVSTLIGTKARGPLTFLTIETTGTNQREEWVFTSTSTIIASQEVS